MGSDCMKEVLDFSSRDIGRLALKLAATEGREEEQTYKIRLKQMGVQSAAVDFGGKFLDIMPKLLEHAAVAAQREAVITSSHVEMGNLVGAVHEALESMARKSIGMNVGGKLSVVRYKEHLCVVIFSEIGILYLNEIGVYLAHRAIPMQN